MLTIVASNRNRMEINSNQFNLFLQGLRKQTDKDFNVLIVDGGSKNFKELQDFFQKEKKINISIIQHLIGDKFERALLNNVGIRNAKTPYILTTDVDIFFAKDFVSIVKEILLKNPNVFLQSRTLYWKSKIANKIYSQEIDPWENLNECKIGRIKKRTTAGGCQCTHINNWNFLRGFNEEMVGWGSEDTELFNRVALNDIQGIWIGESMQSIRVFHQPHQKENLAEDLKCQEENKKILNKEEKSVNQKGWGGIVENI